MTLEQTIQFLFDFYPSIFPTRKHALNQLFITVGNGYEWKDGQLVESTDCNYKNETIYFGETGLKYKVTVPKVEKAKISNLQEIRNKINDINKIPFNWYGVDKENRLVITKEIHPNLFYNGKIDNDWFSGLQETFNLIRKDGIVVYSQPMHLIEGDIYVIP